MEKSDDYIDFKAYTGYLRRVTRELGDPQSIRTAVYRKAVARTELQTAHLLLKKLAAAVLIVLLAFGLMMPVLLHIMKWFSY